MGKDNVETIAVEATQANMMDYEEASRTFDWADVEKGSRGMNQEK